MMKTHQALSEEIEQLVRDHIEASRRAATAAVERAFASSVPPSRTKVGVRKTRKTIEPRRGRQELAAIGEELYAKICAQPGETMSALAPELGKTPRELQHPMMVLRREGRIRSVGQRSHMRYFPAFAQAPSDGS